MGWLWSSSPGENAANGEDRSNERAPAGSTSAALTDEQRMRIFGRAGVTPAPTQAASTSTREQQADVELDALLQSFAESDSAFKQKPEASDLESQGREKEPTPDPGHYDRILPDGTLDISPEAIYPRTMSCRAAFDQAFYCQSVGGKFNDIYRYGQLRQCSEQWSAFWFCMRVRQLPDKDKAVQIRDHYMQRDEERRKKFGNSEDVWEIRKVAITDAFQRDPDADEAAQNLASEVKQ